MAADRAPALRPLGVGDVLDELFAVYRRGFRTLVGIATIVHIPLAIATLGFIPLFAGAPQMYGFTPSRQPDFGPMLAWSLAALAIAMPLFVVGSILELSATCYATSALYLGESPRILAAYRQALGRFWRIFRLGLIFAAVVIGLNVASFVAVVFPPLLCVTMPAAFVALAYLAVAWSLALPALVLEDLPGAIRALGRSRELVRGAWWRTCVTLLLLGVLIGILQLIAGGLVSALFGLVMALLAAGATSPPIWIAILNSLLGSAVNVLFAPLIYIGITLLYYDRRVRVEAYDLTILARDLEQQRNEPAAL